jgi:hypothetical protein
LRSGSGRTRRRCCWWAGGGGARPAEGLQKRKGLRSQVPQKARSSLKRIPHALSSLCVIACESAVPSRKSLRISLTHCPFLSHVNRLCPPAAGRQAQAPRPAGGGHAEPHRRPAAGAGQKPPRAQGRLVNGVLNGVAGWIGRASHLFSLSRHHFSSSFFLSRTHLLLLLSSPLFFTFSSPPLLLPLQVERDRVASGRDEAARLRDQCLDLSRELEAAGKKVGRMRVWY